jgi:hypothetical protein
MQGMGLRGGRFPKVAQKPTRLAPISAREHTVTPRNHGDALPPVVPASMPASGRRQSRLVPIEARDAAADDDTADAADAADAGRGLPRGRAKPDARVKRSTAAQPPPMPPMPPAGWLAAPVTALGAAAAAAAAAASSSGGAAASTPTERGGGGGSPSKRKRLSAESREERRHRKAAAARAASERQAAEAAEAQRKEHETMVSMLREYEEATRVSGPPSPVSELARLAEEASEPHLCKELRLRLRSAAQQVLAEQPPPPPAALTAAAAAVLPTPRDSRNPSRNPSRVASPRGGGSGGGSGGGGGGSRGEGKRVRRAPSPPGQSDEAAGAPVVDPMAWLRPAQRGLHPTELATLISRLRPEQPSQQQAAQQQAEEEGSALAGDAWIAERLFVSLDPRVTGELPAEVAVKGLFPAFSRERSVRLRWLWERIYDPHRKGSLSSVDIFGLLEQVPEGSRLEEDLLALVKTAAAKRTDGVPVRIDCDEYVAGLRGHRTEEADPLGLRKRRRHGDAARMLRARARSMLLAQQWMAGASSADAAGAQPDPSQQAAAAAVGKSRRVSMR